MKLRSTLHHRNGISSTVFALAAAKQFGITNSFYDVAYSGSLPVSHSLLLPLQCGLFYTTILRPTGRLSPAVDGVVGGSGAPVVNLPLKFVCVLSNLLSSIARRRHWEGEDENESVTNEAFNNSSQISLLRTCVYFGTE